MSASLNTNICLRTITYGYTRYQYSATPTVLVSEAIKIKLMPWPTNTRTLNCANCANTVSVCHPQQCNYEQRDINNFVRVYTIHILLFATLNEWYHCRTVLIPQPLSNFQKDAIIILQDFSHPWFCFRELPYRSTMDTVGKPMLLVKLRYGTKQIVAALPHILRYVLSTTN